MWRIHNSKICVITDHFLTINPCRAELIYENKKYIGISFISQR